MADIAGIILIVIFIIVGIIAGIYFLNRYTYKKMNQQQALIDKNKVTASIYVIDKKRQLPTDANLPKAVIEAMPRLYKMRKAYCVKAKVGPQIATLMCEKKIFEELHPKKTFKVELAGMYIVGLKGHKVVTSDKKKLSFSEKISATMKNVMPKGKKAK